MNGLFSVLAGPALLAIVFVAYAPAFRAGFIWDDDYNISNNPTLRTADGLRQMWFVPQSVQQYYPLMYTTFWTEYRLWGLNPLGYHIVNLLLHGVAAILVWRLLLRLRVSGAWLAAAIFAVHPVAAESVVWVTERKNVLSLTLTLAAMLCYSRFARWDETSQSTAAKQSTELRWYVMAIALFALALSAKTAVVTMPAVLLVIDWWKRGFISWRDVALKLPFFGLSVFAGLITVWMELYHVGAIGDEWSLSGVERLLLAGRALWFYAGKLLWPYPLAFFYPHWDINTQVWWQYLFPAAAVGVPILLWFARQRIGRGPLAAVLIFAGVLMPALGFVNIYYMQYAYVADHFQYHASIALITLVAASFTLWANKLPQLSQRWAHVAAALSLLALAMLSFRHSRIYENLEVFYRDIITHNPRCWMAYVNLTVHLESQDRFQEALELSNTFMSRLDEDGVAGKYRAQAEKGLAFVLMGTGRLGEAKIHFQKSRESDPDDPKTLYGLGMAQVKSSAWDEAAATFEKSVELFPNYAGGYAGLGAVCVQQQRVAEAIELYDRALELNAADPLAHFDLANLLFQQAKLAEAAAHYKAALQFRPEFPEALFNLSIAEFRLGDLDLAIQHIRALLELNPNHAQARAALQAFEEARGGR